jgi:hypothetical protein
VTTGAGVRVAVIDSGAVAGHPHLPSVAGGVTITPEGQTTDFADRLGHGTAVAAAIHEKAPDAELWIARVFVSRLAATADVLIRAIDWSIGKGVRLINLSLGTANPAHELGLAAAVARAQAAGCWIVAAAEADGVRWLPGSLAGTLGVVAAAGCPRDIVRTIHDGPRTLLVAAPYPRPIDGLPVERNLSGVSFAVANATGMLAKALQRDPAANSLEQILSAVAVAPGTSG